jgi:hypothetical protein
MLREESATLNGHGESSVFAPSEAVAEPVAWPVREDLWETFEDMNGQEDSAATLSGESPFESVAQEDSAYLTSFEYSPFSESAFEDASSENVGGEDPSLESIHSMGESAYEDTRGEEYVGEDSYELTGYEHTGYEDVGYEDTGYESVPQEDSTYEDTGFENGYESNALEDSAFESVGLESAYEVSETPTEYNAELLGWPGEIAAEDWAVGGEHAQEDTGPTVDAGERAVNNYPLLRAHRGTQPDLVIRWNRMPSTTRTVDVVIHLHGYSGSGPRMRILDKARMSGIDFVPPSGGAAGTTRPMLGVVPRGNYFGGNSGAGYNFPELIKPGALEKLVRDSLELFRSATGVRASAGRVILTGHSGGGAPLNAILQHSDVDQVYVFDGTYGDMSNVVAWARRRIARGAPNSALRVLYRPNSGTQAHALAIASAICPAITASSDAARLHQRFRVESTTVEHNLIPTTFGWRLLADPAGDLPGATRRGCSHTTGPSSALPSAGPTSPVPPVAPGVIVTRTPDRVAGIVKVTPWRKDGTRALPGSVALANQWRRLTGRAAGTFNARNTSFGTRSLHAEGRAVDCHGFSSRPQEKAQADAYITWLLTNAVELQVSTIIWNKRIWSWTRRAEGWRNYMTKQNHNPHTDHFHVDLSWEGALQPSPLFAGGVPGFGAGVVAAPARQTRSPSNPAATPVPATGVKHRPVEFVRLFGPYAKASEAKTGVPGLVTLAQAAVESGWGARAAGNNFFGIKARASDAPDTRQLWRTREVLSRPDIRSFPEVISVTPRADGRYTYVVKDWFRVFASPELAFVSHGALLRRNKRYAKAFQYQNDPYGFMAEVAKAGYATDPNYAKVVQSVMRRLEQSGWK